MVATRVGVLVNVEMRLVGTDSLSQQRIGQITDNGTARAVCGYLVGPAGAGACWLPVLWLQHQMQQMAAAAVAAGDELPVRYHRYFKIWFFLGWPAFVAVLVIFYLMVNKPL